MQPDPYLSCKSKLHYSKKDAQTVRNKLLREGVPHIRIYSCGYCNRWHLTKNESYEERKNNSLKHQQKENRRKRLALMQEED